MDFWVAAVPRRFFCTRTFAVALAVALSLAMRCESQAANPEPKRVLMLHSFGLRFKPWTTYAEAIRTEISRRGNVDFQDQSLVTARLDSDKSDGPFVEYLHALNAEGPPDLIVAIGAPAANFVQRHRKELFPKTPMILTAVQERRVDFAKLTEYDTVVASTTDVGQFFENILQVRPLTNTIAVVVGTSPNETFWMNARRQDTASLAGRLQFRWYNEMSFDDILKDAAALPPNSAIYWLMMNVDGAGVTHEGNTALSRLSAVANAPIFAHDGTYFGEGTVGGPMHSVPELSKKTAEVAIRILNGEKAGDIKPSFVPLAAPIFDWRQMQRWGIAESALPPGSTTAFRGPTVWERYLLQIALITAVIILQAGLIVALLHERRRRQLAEVQSARRTRELALASRFATAGELTASIAHEMNQPLGAILTNAETAQEILKSQSQDIAERPDIIELRDIVDDIVHDDQRASEVIRRMRSLLKRSPFDPKTYDFNEVVRETVSLFSTVAAGRKVELASLLAPFALPIICDHIQLQQVIINLVGNAIEAMKDTPAENRIISIQTSNVEKFAELSVSDRGPGIPEDKLKEVFEPFYTCKAEGMGMGLSIARTIVEAHNGAIWATNRDHGGATFRIRLPLVS